MDTGHDRGKYSFSKGAYEWDNKHINNYWATFWSKPIFYKGHGTKLMEQSLNKNYKEPQKILSKNGLWDLLNHFNVIESDPT